MLLLYVKLLFLLFFTCLYFVIVFCFIILCIFCVIIIIIAIFECLAVGSGMGGLLKANQITQTKQNNKIVVITKQQPK